MEESLRLSQKQRLQQTLSPLQVQFVRLLEMNGHEIEEEVDRELAENPALEIASESAPERMRMSAILMKAPSSCSSPTIAARRIYLIINSRHATHLRTTVIMSRPRLRARAR